MITNQLLFVCKKPSLNEGIISLSNIIPFTTKSLPTVRKPEVVFPLLSVTTFLIKLSLLTQICKLLPSDYFCTVLLLYVLYISPQGTPINETNLFILAGDFNGHNVMWGCNDTNQRGLQLENFISNNSFSFMNDNKSKTYLHPATGSYSSIDLTLCSPVLLSNFTWKVTEDLCGSDHFPIYLYTTIQQCMTAEVEAFQSQLE